MRESIMALRPCNECEREISTDAKSCPHCGKRNPTKVPISGRELGLWLLVVFVLVAIGLATSDRKPAPPHASTVASPAPDRGASKEFALDQMKLTFTWHRGGFETAMIGNFVITNGGAVPVKDVVVTCEHFG